MHHPKALGGLLAAAIAVAANSGATSAAVPYPRSMAALGDSLTLAYPNTVEESWATGGNPLVRSHYLRILAAGGGAIRGHAYNLAVPGASFLAMQAQARRALAKRVEYVTVWGGEEWCGADDLVTLEQDFDALLHVLASGRQPPWVFVASVRDQGAIYRTLKAHRPAVLRTSRTV